MNLDKFKSIGKEPVVKGSVLKFRNPVKKIVKISTVLFTLNACSPAPIQNNNRGQDATVDAGFIAYDACSENDAKQEDAEIETDANQEDAGVDEDGGSETDGGVEDDANNVGDAGIEDSSVETDAGGFFEDAATADDANGEDTGLSDATEVDARTDAGSQEDAHEEDGGNGGQEDGGVIDVGTENHAPTIDEVNIPNETFSIDPYEFSFQLNDADGDALEWEVIIENIGRFFKPFSVTQGSGTYEYNAETNIVTIIGVASAGDTIVIRTENVGDGNRWISIKISSNDGKGGFRKIRIPVGVI